MPTKLLWKSLDLYSISNRYQSKCPLEWSPKTQSLVYHNKIKDVFWWYFNFYGLVLGMGLGSIVLVLLKQILNPKPNVTGVHVVLYLILIALFLVVFGVAISVTFHGEMSVTTCNQAFAFRFNFSEETHSHKNRHGTKSTTSNWKSLTWISSQIPLTSSNQIDWLGIIVTGMVITAGISQLLVPWLGILGGLDPWQFILEDILPPSIWNMWITQIAYKIIATALLFIIMPEMIRMIPMILMMFVLPVLANLENIRLMMRLYQKCKSPKDFIHLYKIFTYQQVISNNSLRYIPVEAFLLTACGAVLACILNFAVMKLYSVVPPLLYAIFVIGDVITLGIIGVILPYAINIHESSTKALFLWKSQCGAKSKYLRRKFGALRSLRFYAGVNDFNLFLYERSVKADYFCMIMDNTVNLLLSVPPSAIEDFSFDLI